MSTPGAIVLVGTKLYLFPFKNELIGKAAEISWANINNAGNKCIPAIPSDREN